MSPSSLRYCVALTVLLTACADEPLRAIGAACTSDGSCASGLCLESRCVDPEADDDLDGLVNRIEGALGTSPSRADSDGDGVPDGDEIDRTTVTHRDSDGDGKPDALESSTADADGDCIPDQLDADDAAPAPDGCGAECVPATGELLADGGFADGAACWVPGPEEPGGRVVVDASEAPSPADAPSLRVERDDAAASPGLTQTTLALAPARSYRLSLDLAGGDGVVADVRLSVPRSGLGPLGFTAAASPEWGSVTVELQVDPAWSGDGAVLAIGHADGGLGSLWLDNVRLVDLGDTPCDTEVWSARGRVPDGELGLGATCWSAVASGTTQVAFDEDEVLAPISAPSMRISQSDTSSTMRLQSRRFELPAGAWVFRYAARTAGGLRQVSAVVGDGEATALVDSTDGFAGAWTEASVYFETANRVTLAVSLTLLPGASDTLWLDRIHVVPYVDPEL